MGCRCEKPNTLNSEDLEVYVPGYNVMEPFENHINNNSLKNVNDINFTENLINDENAKEIEKELNKRENSKDEKFANSNIHNMMNNLSRILSVNTSNFENNNNYISNKITNFLQNQSVLNLDRSETRWKSLTKTLVNCTTLNLSFNNAFSLDMLREINLIRKNPTIYVNKIKDFMKYIITDKETDRKYILVNKHTKIKLMKGEEAFLECLNFIDEFDKKLKLNNKSLSELELKEELKFPFPNDDPEKCINKDYIKENLLLLKKNLEKNFKIKGFHYDLSTNDPEISTILQLVDDNNSRGKRRNMLLDENIKYIGINIGKLKDNLFCIYLMFAA